VRVALKSNFRGPKICNGIFLFQNEKTGGLAVDLEGFYFFTFGAALTTTWK
jgi:hypothetical protein